MTVDVRMPDILAERARSGAMRLTVPHREGMTALDVVHDQGFTGDEAATILVVVNGTQAAPDAPVHDGDTVELVVPMVGG